MPVVSKQRLWFLCFSNILVLSSEKTCNRLAYSEKINEICLGGSLEFN